MDTVTEFCKAQARHNRNLQRFTTGNPKAFSEKDHEGLKATRAARDSAVAALSRLERLVHIDGLSKKQAEERLAYETLAKTDRAPAESEAVL